MRIEMKMKNEWIGGYSKLKKQMSALLVFIMIASSMFALPVEAATENTQGKVTNTPVYVDGKKAKQEIISISINNSLYLPLRATSQLLGLKVDWSQAEQAVYITTRSTSVAASSNNETGLKAGSTISGTVSNATIFVDDKQVQLKDSNGIVTPPLSFQGSVYLPLRTLATFLGLEIDWDNNKSQVNINTQSADEKPTGEKGEQGEQGIKGDKGEKGDTGSTGSTGATGLAGSKGDKGDPGATGPAGPAGATGPAGSAGSKGDKGDTGSAGPAGLQGDKGDTGAIGPAGPQGNKGDTGATGPAGPQGPQGESGSFNVPWAYAENPFFPGSITSDGVSIEWDILSNTLNYYSYAGDGINVVQAGFYYITYHVNLTEAKSIGTRLLINGSALVNSSIPAAHAKSSYSATVIAYITAGSKISLQLYGASELVNLVSQGQGASLSILKIS